MKGNVNRRDFMKVAGATSAGVTIATGFNPFAYAANETVRVGLIGTGGQGSFHIREGLAGNDTITIAAVADVFKAHQDSGVKMSQLSNAGIKYAGGGLTTEQKAAATAAYKPAAYYDYHEMLEKEELDGVVIATPLDTHFQIAMDCLDAGKYVFSEKTLVRDIELGRQLVTKCHDVGKWVQVGHQRRYNAKYNLAMKLAFEDERIGRITHVTAQWHRNSYWRRNVEALFPGYELNETEKKYIKTDLEHHLNWRMYDATSGGLFTELATHQTDIANWFMKKPPSRVRAFGGLDYWRDGRDVDDNILCAFEYDLSPGDEGHMDIERRSELQKTSQINRNYTVRFVYTSILANAKRGASELIQGDRGTIELTEADCFMYAEPAPIAEMEAKMKKIAAMKAAAESGEKPKEEDDVGAIASGKSLQVSNKALLEGVELLGDRKVKAADDYQFEAFAHHIKNGGVPQNNHMVGFTTAITAISAIKSKETGDTVEIDPAWYTFDFDVPSMYAYNWDDAKYPKKTAEEMEQKDEAGAEADA